MANVQGDFIWYELLTSDADAAADFYGHVIGWSSQSSGQPDMDYRFFSSGDGTRTQDGVGGFMAINDEMAEHGVRPAWIGYIAVDDVDAAIALCACQSYDLVVSDLLMPGQDGIQCHRALLKFIGKYWRGRA